MATVTELYSSAKFQIKSSISPILMVTIAALLPPVSSAAEWKLSPRVELKETYTSNVYLAPLGNEKADYITQLNPGAIISGTGPHFNLSAGYLMQNFVYANTLNKNSTRHLLNAAGDAEIVDEYFYLDAKSSVSQQSTSPLTPLSLDNGNVLDDRTEIRTYSLSPYLSHRFGSLLAAELRYTHDAVSSNENELLNSNANHSLFRLKNSSSSSVTKWEIEYRKQHTDYINTSIDTEHEKYFLKLGYLLTSRFSLNATGGHERFDYVSMNQKPEGGFWLAGFSWRPRERTHISANGGKRFWGDTYSLMASHRARRSVWNIAYNEDITDTRSQFLMPAAIDTASFLNQLWEASIPDPLLRQQVVEAFMLENGIPASLSNPVNFLSNRVFLQKRLQASVALLGAKSSILFNIFNILRDAQTSSTTDSALLGASNIALSDSSRQAGANVTWLLKTSSVSGANAGFSYIQHSFPDSGLQTDTRSISLNLIRKFLPDLNGSLGLRHIRRESNTGSAEYRENAITASMQMVF